MTRQTVYRRPVFRNGALPVRRRRRLLNRSFDEGDRLLYPTRAMAATCPIHRDEGSFAVFKGLSRRILDFAALRKLTARWVSYRALSSSRTPSAINPLEFACANRVRNGRSDRCLVQLGKVAFRLAVSGTEATTRVTSVVEH
jgi:hypothetical protein